MTQENCKIGLIWANSAYTIHGAALAIVPLVCVIVEIILGNGLVILAVVKTQTLRMQKQNWIICSLAAADFLVGLLVMPVSLTYEIVGQWKFGSILCEVWLALDVLFITASTVNLCAISLDRYWAVTDPINYPQQRTIRKMVMMICGSWLIAVAISLPPMVIPHEVCEGQCSLSVDTAYVLYSALGSFGLPVVILIAVNIKIFKITRNRMNEKLRESFLKVQRLSTCSARGTTGSSMESAQDKNEVKTHEQGHETSYVTCNTSTPDMRNRTNVPEPAGSEQNCKNYSNTTDLRFQTKLYGSTCPVTVIGQKSLTSPLLLAETHQDKDTTLQTKLTPPSTRMSFNELNLKTPEGDESMIQRLSTQSHEELVRHLEEKHKELKQKDRQTTFILGVVVCAFVGCWTPFFIIYVLGAFGVRVSEILFDICFWIGYCNSALNPIIYTMFNRDFRTSFYKIICRK